MPQTSPQSDSTQTTEQFDAVIVGAGFAGLYMLHKLRNMGMSCRVFEAADNVGGTWYWNRYPGARCDAESLAYSYSFSPELEQDWEWSERYASQPEILRYIEHVAERFDLRRDIRFERRVHSAHFDAAQNAWHLRTEQGDQVRARFCIMATGCLSVPTLPNIEGLEQFSRARYQASAWPHEGVDFSGLRVGVIGTGSSAIQAIPVMAEQAAQLTVFQRTPNFSVPAKNAPLDPSFVQAFKEHYRDHRDYHQRGLSSGFGDLSVIPEQNVPGAESGHALSQSEVNAICQRFWDQGGARFMGAIADAIIDPAANEKVATFVRQQIQQLVKDPETAAALSPDNHPIGTRRICVDTDYYATYNRPNVELVNLLKTPIEHITATGIQTSARHHELDALVLATGFDAMTGALARIDIRGTDGATLKEQWQDGPRTYLGLMASGFPNFFMITGPGSPSVLSNMMVSIEQHVDFIAAALSHMQDHQQQRVEAQPQAQDQWVAHVNEIADATLFPQGGSWYLGANVEGKPRVFMPYAAGVGAYREACDAIAADNYRGFAFA
ncbi:MAG: flavin-containing monooxygenase [Pseudomonadales bacterium]